MITQHVGTRSLNQVQLHSQEYFTALQKPSQDTTQETTRARQQARQQARQEQRHEERRVQMLQRQKDQYWEQKAQVRQTVLKEQQENKQQQENKRQQHQHQLEQQPPLSYLYVPKTPNTTIPLWTVADNMTFEEALSRFNAPSRWSNIAELLPGKTAKDVKRYYQRLVYDMSELESGYHVTWAVAVEDIEIPTAPAILTLK